jgi:hypothetical protein
MTAAYDRIGGGYAAARRADPRIEARILAALGDAERIIDVGAGTGSYEPADRVVVAVDASMVMLRQRPSGSAPSVLGVAERLPFPDWSFDAALAILTLHHWTTAELGLAEMTRVAVHQVVLMFQPAGPHWLTTDYFPGHLETSRSLSVADVASRLGARSIETVLVPADCVDGFGGAYWNRPERYLDPVVQAGISSFAGMDALCLSEGMARLRADLDSGAWDARHGYLRQLSEIDLGYRLVVT